ncbi:hypothetical protein [Scytonema sp. HK-05]|nr:hypothetical protein [Scytonema sp. HK-05]
MFTYSDHQVKLSSSIIIFIPAQPIDQPVQRTWYYQEQRRQVLSA